MKLERDLMKQISQRLSVYTLTGEVQWWTRLNSGKVKTYYGSFIKLCDKNTPDFLALIRDRQDTITALFIEAKSDTGTVEKGQIAFADKYNRKDNIRVITLRDIKELDTWVDKYAKDYVASITLENL